MKVIENAVKASLRHMEKSGLSFKEAVGYAQTDLDNFLKNPTGLTSVHGAQAAGIPLEDYVKQKEAYLRLLLEEVKKRAEL